MPSIESLMVKIIRFVDSHQPGMVECEFSDADGRRHNITDKAPIFTTASLDVYGSYPQMGLLRCEVKARWTDASGRELAEISTASPDAVESAEGLSDFIIVATQLSTADSSGYTDK
jgi:hypothetical protein